MSIDGHKLRRAYLQRTSRFSELAPLIAKLGPNGELNREFVRAYFRSNAPYGRRSLLLRLALGDERAWRRTRSLPRLTPGLLRNIVLYLECHPQAPLHPFQAHFSREDVPSHLATLVGHSRMAGAEFVRRAVVRPYFRALMGNQPFPGKSDEVSARQAKLLLARVARRAVLQTDDVNRFLGERFTKTVGDFFFDSGVPALDARNILKFAAGFFACHGHGGRLQSKIPVAVAKRMGIRRVSVPHLMIAVDVLALGVLGSLKSSPRRAPGALAQLISDLSRLPERAHAALPDLRTLARHHFRRSLLDPTASAELRRSQAQHRSEYMYRTGLYFNLERLVEGHGAGERFTYFGTLYDRVDTVRLAQQVRRHFLRTNRPFGIMLSEAMRLVPTEFRGISCRSLANTLFHARWLTMSGEEPGTILPAVAKYRLGMPEPQHGAMHHRRLTFSRRRRRPGQRIRNYPDRLPLLDRLSASTSILNTQAH